MPKPLEEILKEIDPKHETKLSGLIIDHVMKSWPKYFGAMRHGIKRFDLRKRKEGRNFTTGQYVLYREWEPTNQTYTGRWDVYYIQYILISEITISFGFKRGLGGDILDCIQVTGN